MSEVLMKETLRVALFSDSYHEANGVARTANELERCAKRAGVQMLLVHAGPDSRLASDGSVMRCQLKRSHRASFELEHDLRFDLWFWRHMPRVAETLRSFAPDVLHFTGP